MPFPMEFARRLLFPKQHSFVSEPKRKTLPVSGSVHGFPRPLKYFTFLIVYRDFHHP